MYCPSCGATLLQEMNYCNRCGINLGLIKGSGSSKSLEKSVESTVWSIVGVTLSMLGMMIAVMALMNGFGLSGEAVVFFMALMFLVLIGIDGLLVWQLSRQNRLAKKARSATQLERSKAAKLNAQPEQLLGEAGMSVTENTTRILEPTYEERRAK